MEGHQQLTDEKFEQRFAQCTLDPQLFTHEAHIRLAWIQVKRYGLNKAVNNVCTLLAAFTKHVGAADKYNTTITVAAVKAVSHFMTRSATNNFVDFMDQTPRLKYHFKELMAQHYAIDIFNSGLAKTKFIEPDLLPFG